MKVPILAPSLCCFLVLLHVTVDSYQPLVVAGSDCIDCSETMKRVSRLRVLGISIIFLGSVPCRAFVGHNGNVNARENAKLTTTGRPSRERTLASRRLERGDSMLTCRPRRRLCFLGALQSQSQDSNLSSLEDHFQFELLSTISAVPEEDWDRCLCSHSSPFMQHSWLRCLEEGGCATVEEGWMPSHVHIRQGDCTIGFVPVRETSCFCLNAPVLYCILTIAFAIDIMSKLVGSSMSRAIPWVNSSLTASGPMRRMPTKFRTTPSSSLGSHSHP